jgi:hypothetical protein
MQVGILSESPADAAAIKILAQAIINRRIDFLEPRRLRAGGWATALNAAATEYRSLYYNTDALGLIIVLDSDDSPTHEASHSAEKNPLCRICQVQAKLQVDVVRSRPNREPLRVAIGTPVPAIEAWYRCGNDPHAAEDRYVRALQSGKQLTAARRQLKRDVYGTDRPSLKTETEVAIQEAQRLTGEIERLRAHFPRGFGSFYETLASWR